jgi:DNA-binding transcriptional LysR family regulator
MHFDLTDLRLFTAIVEAGSITAGADRSGLALAAASARVRGMEATLGASLLERGRRGVRPTPAGVSLARHARLVLAQMEILRGELREHARGGPRGLVRLLANSAAAGEHLPELLAAWLAANPGVDLDLDERPSYEIARAVAQGRADAGVLAEPEEVSGLELHPFCRDRLALVVPRGHELGRRQSVHFAEVLGSSFVGLAADSALGRLLAGQAAVLGHPPAIRVRAGGFEAVCRYVAQGVGIAVMPELAALRCADRLALATVPLADGWASRRLMVCVRQLSALSPHARRLIEHLIEAGAGRA